MKLLRKMIYPTVSSTEGRIFERRAARGIVLEDSKILLMYTKHYNDYSFPGGGVDLKEDLMQGLKRELHEETGAKGIEVISEFGYIDELRPHYKPEFDLIHMLSYFYLCKTDKEFDTPKLEDYEIKNGMMPVWIDVREAIEHNKNVIKAKEKSMGLSIERETFVMEKILEQNLM